MQIVAHTQGARMAGRRWRTWWGWTVALLAGAAIVVAIGLGPLDAVLRDRDANVVLLAWNDAQRRLVVNERIHAPLQPDGPYVRPLADGRVEVMRVVARGAHAVAERRVLPAPAAEVIDVEVDDAGHTRFRVRLRGPAAPRPAIFAQPSRMLLLSDLEGDLRAFAALLRAQGVVDDALHWRYGDGHLVLAGDFMDRCEDVLPLLWLIYRLEGEAAHAGGGVHFVLGNHELLALAGRFAAAPQRLFASRDAFFDGDSRRVFAADTVLGQWLRAHNVVERIGDTLVVHGGVSEVFLREDLDIDEANAIARRELDVDRRRLGDAARPVLGRYGLPWYYGMAAPGKRGVESDASAHLDAVLRRYGVRRVAVGHTTAPRVMLQREGRLLRLDVDHLRQGAEGALFEHGRWWRVSAAGTREPL